MKLSSSIIQNPNPIISNQSEKKNYEIDINKTTLNTHIKTIKNDNINNYCRNQEINNQKEINGNYFPHINNNNGQNQLINYKNSNIFQNNFNQNSMVNKVNFNNTNKNINNNNLISDKNSVTISNLGTERMFKSNKNNYNNAINDSNSNRSNFINCDKNKYLIDEDQTQINLQTRVTVFFKF